MVKYTDKAMSRKGLCFPYQDTGRWVELHQRLIDRQHGREARGPAQLRVTVSLTPYGEESKMAGERRRRQACSAGGMDAQQAVLRGRCRMIVGRSCRGCVIAGHL